jgi:hypothetical protein
MNESAEAVSGGTVSEAFQAFHYTAVILAIGQGVKNGVQSRVV